MPIDFQTRIEFAKTMGSNAEVAHVSTH